MNKLFCKSLLYLFLSLLSTSNFAFPKHDMSLFQTGNPSALLSGVTEGSMTFHELKSKGNFGLGTFNGIQGEMVALNGKFYQIGQYGKTISVPPDWKTPWVQLVTFSPTSFNKLNNINHLAELKEKLYAKFSNKNIPYAIVIKGHFNSLDMRSRTPRKSLEIKNIHEDTYQAKDISGTLVGFRFPEYLLNIAVPGFHFHFISDDKKLSGHVLNLTSNHLEYAFNQINSITFNFPRTDNYQQTNIKAPTMETYHKAQM